LQATPIRIGTRGSPLALAQANMVRASLSVAHGFTETDIEIVPIRTSGDRIQDRPLAEIGGKGLFTKEIEEALQAGSIDMAVHSMKDMPTVLPDGLDIVAMLPRADVRDAFLSPNYASLADLPQGGRLGSSSLRRAAQVRRLRPDVAIVPLRGNVETRLRKLAEGVADATLLAAAGLARLGMTDRITQLLEPEDMLPAVAQGAIGIEINLGNSRAASLVAAIDHAPTRICVNAERAFLARLDGSCRTPIAGLARLDAEGNLSLIGELLAPDGSEAVRAELSGRASDSIRIGTAVAEAALSKAGPAIKAMIG
jgi:hydroxymethylbilane synthase